MPHAHSTPGCRRFDTEHLFVYDPEHMFVPLTIRRLLPLLAALGVSAALLLGFASPSPGASPARPYTVRSGDTLWSISRVAYPHSDPREAVYRIEQANQLPGATIVAGQTILLP